MDIALFVNNIWPVKKQWRPLNQNQLKQYLNLLENGISVAIRQWQNFWWEQRNVLSKKYAMQMEHVIESATKISPTRPKGIVLKKDMKLSPDTKESITVTKQSGTSTDR